MGTTGDGVFKSMDGAETWNQVNSGLPNHLRVHSLAIDPLILEEVIAIIESQGGTVDVSCTPATKPLPMPVQ